VRIRNPKSEIRDPQFAFTLLEVMIASAIFFMAMFSVLALVASTLRNARGLQRRDVDAGMLAAELSLTNKLSESSDSGDFGDIYPGYTWRREVYLAPVAPTNGFFQVDFTVSHKAGNQATETRMSILLFRPNSQQGIGSVGAPLR
jgi:Tfp pilus assembly protein PilV